jgi:hypothetical protein
MSRFPDFSKEHAWLANLPGVEVMIPPVYSELPMLKSVFELLCNHPLFKAFNWVIAHMYADQPHQFSTSLNHSTIMIYLSNEDFRIPAYASELGLIFTPYWWPTQPSNLRAIPLGCNGEVPELTLVPWPERELDLFYSGHAHKYRQGLYHFLQEVLLQFRPCEQELAAIALWSSRFRAGLDAQSYARFLSQSRVALVPRGHSAMTYRLFEAMRAGCVLLCDNLPPAWYLEHCPRIVMPADWHNLRAVLESLWQEPALMQDMHLKTLANYHHFCRPEAVAQYILAELQLLI